MSMWNSPLPARPVPSCPKRPFSPSTNGNFHFFLSKIMRESFLLREVRLGPAADGHYSVLEGLRLQEKVVTEGSFILKAESVRQHPELH